MANENMVSGVGNILGSPGGRGGGMSMTAYIKPAIVHIDHRTASEVHVR